MDGGQLYADVWEGGGEGPGRHEEEGGGGARVVSVADWGCDLGGEGGVEVADEGVVRQVAAECGGGNEDRGRSASCHC